ncbi:ABC transporter substrate-binding protein [Alkalithermobacter paradoxus]|uniref:ABC transporter substrate-binding protein n=1 Tax=Alkalithermobacter paradoxus TaxID=29349 RepID=A0A1V4IBN7_9FIRM|nr:hypothetical protein CLOTH_05570 [[Clostridium] thermoalcaliphilum]
MKRFIAMLLIVLLAISFIGCSKSEQNVSENLEQKDWESILESSKGSTVNFYGWGGSDRINTWIDTYLAPRLKEEYDITLNRVPMNIDDILNKLLGEKQLDVKDGTIDVVWINGENFYTAKTNDLLYGPFTHKLPNFSKYVDADSVEVKYDFGFEVEGYEAPYGKAQFVMIYDKDRVQTVPRNHQELLELVKANPGKFTYPAPPDFTGSAFVRNIIYDIVGYEQFINMEADKEKIRKEIEPAIEFLKELKPYLWREGKTYPATIAQLDNMYSDKEIFMTMSYNPNSVSAGIISGQFPETTDSFVFDKGTIGNTHFLAIPFNSTNKEGALAVINFILTPEVQASKYNPENWGDLSVLDNSKLSQEEKSIFEAIKVGKGVVSLDELLSHRLPEMPANLVPIIEEIWLESIPEGE